MKQLLEKIFIDKESKDKYIIFNHDDKTWVMPSKGFKAAFEMYQPSSFKGKVFKNIAILFKSNLKMLCKLRFEQTNLTINEELAKVIKENLNIEDFYVAGYMGDSSSWQNNKSTLQIYNENKILAYVKITMDKKVGENFNREISNLKYLEENGITNIPKVLADTNVGDMQVFIQSTDKGLKEKVKFKFGKKQIDFVSKYVKTTECSLKYEESDLYDYIQYLKENAESHLPEEEYKTVKESIKIVEENLSESKLMYSFFHGDFTPWNVYYTDGEIFAFDFEYCLRTMPSYMDIFQYMTQMSLLGYHNDIGKTVSIFKNSKKLLGEYITNPELTYMCYLLFIISFYMKRSGGKFDFNEKNYREWIGILDYLNKK